ncbi:MAG: M81 family metallopeptidase [Chloroflexota bacterium]
MRIFAAGIATETNTFAPFPTGMADYERVAAADYQRHSHTTGFAAAINAWYDECQKRGWEFCPGLTAWAQPAGITPRPVYEALRDEMLGDLRAVMPVDAVLLNLHGSMIAEGYDDCETDIIDRVRNMVGDAVPIGVELDLHCDLTDQMLAQADAIVLFKEYPHIDVAERARDLFDIIARTLLGEIKPTMAAFDCRMLGMYLTPFQPMRGFVDAMIAQEGKDGVLSLSLFHTFPWADVPTTGVQMLAITDNDPTGAQEVAEAFGRRFFNLRHELLFDSLPMQEAIGKAITHTNHPIVVADQADNAGGGAPSDSTFALRYLLDNGITNAAVAMIWDPIAVQVAQAAGEGAALAMRIGGKMGPMSGDPLDLQVTVTKIMNDMTQEWPQGDGQPLVIDVGDAVALHCQGIDIVLNSKRSQVFSPQVFAKLGIDPTQKQVLIVKSTQHFYAGFEPIAAEIIYMSAPGAIAPRFAQIPYQHVSKDKFPWIDDPFAASPKAT